jgi:hypothetical protein
LSTKKKSKVTTTSDNPLPNTFQADSDIEIDDEVREGLEGEDLDPILVDNDLEEEKNDLQWNFFDVTDIPTRGKSIFF